LGLGKTLREIEAMDAREFAEWQAYYAIDPWGDQREDLRTAMVCQLVSAFGGKPPPLRDFMPFADEARKEREPISAEALSGVLMQAQAWMKHGNNGS